MLVLDDVKKSVIGIISRLNDDTDFVENDDLIESGLLDSLKLVQLLVELEEKLNIKVNLDLVTIDNFKTVDKIVNSIIQMDGARI